MIRPVRIARLALVTAAVAFQLVSMANAQGAVTRPMKHHRAVMSAPAAGLPDTAIKSQEKSAWDPVAQGGNTGGSTNPSINDDGLHHGYNGG